jgi:hypothetical protein
VSAPQDAENNVPQPTERLISRRTMLRAVVITVPVVAAYASNLWAVSGQNCPSGYTYCGFTGCNNCIKLVGHCGCTKANSGTGGCFNSDCQQTAPSARSSSIQAPSGLSSSNNPGFGPSPFDSSQPSPIGDGGFNKNPWN